MECLSIWILILYYIVGTVDSQAVAPSASARDSWNIACGASSTVTAANGLMFDGDGLYIRTGVSKDIPASATNNTLSPELSTLRAFPTAHLKNCYRIPVEQGTKVLVRTRHFYSNYDGLNSPPSFMVYFETALSCDMRVDSSADFRNICEVVYVTTKKQGTDICLVRTKDDQTPFVSTIVIQRLPPNMYSLLNFTTQALSMVQRFAFGALDDIGYPNDTYNRIWKTKDLNEIGAVMVSTDGVVAVNTSRTNNAPPALLFKAAVVAPVVDNTTAANLTIRTTWLPSDPRDTYFTMYFTDSIASNGTSVPRKRAINVYMDGELISDASNPIQPVYGFGLEYSPPVYKASTETVFVLESANVSTLPPAISGMESFLINDVNVATNSNNVEVLSMLQTNFTVLQNWTGDPCLPKYYNWEWVGCDYNQYPPRIFELRLGGLQLSGGNIPDFSALDGLKLVDLSNNSFTGKVPDFIASLRNLQTLDLSNNSFDSIPPSLLNNRNLTLIYKGNPKLESGSASTPRASGCNKVGQSRLAVLLVVLAAVAVA